MTNFIKQECSCQTGKFLIDENFNNAKTGRFGACLCRFFILGKIPPEVIEAMIRKFAGYQLDGRCCSAHFAAFIRLLTLILRKML